MFGFWESCVGAVPPVNTRPLQPSDPADIGEYEILGRLGEGGMGTVYLGRGADGLVAVKVIKPELAEDVAYRRRFAAEVDNARRVASFCTSSVLGQGVHDARPYLVTEFIEGPTLHAYVTRQGALPVGTLHGVAIGVAAALTAIHSAGLVHRDLKPSNVILSVSGPRVIDFGIAHALDGAARHTQTGDVVGSPGWMAPEVLMGSDTPTSASDIYNWGCLVAYAGRARHPHGDADPIAMTSRILHATPGLDELPTGLRDLVAAAMQQEPELRPSAQSLLLDLAGHGQRSSAATAAHILRTGWRSPAAGAEVIDSDIARPAQPDVTDQDDASGADDTTQTTTRVMPGGIRGWFFWPAFLRRRWLSLAAAAGAGLAALALLLWPADDRHPATSWNLADAGFTPVPLDTSRPTDIGRPITETGVEFTVGWPRCGARSFQESRAKQGQLCLVPLSIRNVSELKTSPHIPAGRQQLEDGRGRVLSALTSPGGFLNGSPAIAPGGLISGVLVFDLPKASRPRLLRLSASDTSKGITVWV